MAETEFYCIADGDKYHAQAVLLFSTLSVFHGLDSALTVFQARPPEGPIADLCNEAFDRLGVRRKGIPEFPAGKYTGWNGDYPIGNKLLAAADARDCHYSVFLDSDTICMAPFDLPHLEPDQAFGAVMSDYLTFGAPGQWEMVYDHFGLKPPKRTERLLRGRRLRTPPYFNAGMIQSNESLTIEDKRVTELLLEVALEIDWNIDTDKRRPFLDQIALAVAPRVYGLRNRILDPSYNLNIMNRNVERPNHPRLLHYHIPSALERWPHGQIAFDMCRVQLGDALYRQIATAAPEPFGADRRLFPATATANPAAD